MDHSACALGTCVCMGYTRLHICLHVHTCVVRTLVYVYARVRFECVQVCLGLRVWENARISMCRYAWGWRCAYACVCARADVGRTQDSMMEI